MPSGACQPDVDPKGPLKDKGGLAAWRKRVERDIERVHGEMEALSAQVRAEPGQPYNLNVYWRKPTGQKSLRWRDRHGTHLTWPTVVRRMPRDRVAPALARWYEQMQEHATVLNTQELLRRRELKTIDKLYAMRAARAAARA